MAEDLWLSEGQLITDDGLVSPIVGDLTIKGTIHAPQDPQQLAYTVVAPGWVDRMRGILAEAATRRVFVQVWGGSIPSGTGASDPIDKSWPGLLRIALAARWGDGGSGYLPLHLAQTFPGASWTAQVGIAGVEWRASSGAATVSYTGLMGTEIRIFHRQNGTGGTTGTWRYRIDGETYIEVTPPTGFGVEPGTVVRSGLTDGPHTLDIERVSGTVGLNGVECRRATGILVHRCCVGGRSMSHYAEQIVRRSTIGITNTLTAITCVAPGHFTSDDVGRYLVGDSAGLPDNAQITAVASATAATISAAATATNAALKVDVGRHSTWETDSPLNSKGNIFGAGLSGTGTGCDLVIVGLGVNDGGDQDADLNSISHGLGNVLGGSGNANREVMIVSEHHAAFASFGQIVGARAIGQAAALAFGGAYVDVWSQGRHSFDYWDGLDLFADTVHPNDAGHAAYAAVPIDLLT